MSRALLFSGFCFFCLRFIDFCDTYENLPIKTYNTMRFIHEKLPSSLEFIVKMDDDVMPNIHLFSRCFSTAAALEAPSINQSTPGLFGWVTVDRVPDSGGKYQLVPGRYPHQTLPAFTHGPAYIVRRTILPRLLTAAAITPVLNLVKLCASEHKFSGSSNDINVLKTVHVMVGICLWIH